MLVCERCSTYEPWLARALAALPTGLNCADYTIAIRLASPRHSGNSRGGRSVATTPSPEAEAAPVQQAQNQESDTNRVDCSIARDFHSRTDLLLDKDCILFHT